MNYINMSVEGNRLRIKEEKISVGGSINYDRCKFTFNDEWVGFTKTVVFSINGDESYRVALKTNACIIPSVCLEKEGILEIGVFGVNDNDVVITTNSVAHHVEKGLNMVGEWIEGDGEFVINAVEEMRRAVDEYTETLSKRVSEEIDRLKTGSDSDSGAPTPSEWYFPIAFTDTEAVSPLSKSGAEYEQFLDFRLNALLRDFPDYVTRKELGTDASEEYMMYSYSFAPSRYDKTIFIAACLHGSDKCGLLAVSHFLDCLCREYRNDRLLKIIHDSVKIVLIPAVNPYALKSNSTYNKNGINLAYNFPYLWEQCDRYKKGDAAADQKETQTVMSCLESIKNDKLSAVIELHTSNITYAGRSVFYTRQHANCSTALADMVNNFNYNYNYVDYTDEAVLAASNNAYLSDYAADTYGVNACQLIWSTNLYGGAFTNYCITKYTELIGNTIRVMAENSRFIPKRRPQQFIKHLSWRKSSDSDVFTVKSTSELEKMPISSYKLKLDAPYNITVNGYVELDVSEACTVKINPVLYQQYSSELDFKTRKEATQFTQELALTAGTHIVPVSSITQGFFSCYNFSNDNQYTEELYFTLMFSSSASDKVKLTSYAVTLTATPSDVAKPIEVLSPIGLCSDYSADDIPTQKVIYPLGTLSEYDKNFNN